MQKQTLNTLAGKNSSAVAKDRKRSVFILRCESYRAAKHGRKSGVFLALKRSVLTRRRMRLLAAGGYPGIDTQSLGPDNNRPMRQAIMRF